YSRIEAAPNRRRRNGARGAIIRPCLTSVRFNPAWSKTLCANPARADTLECVVGAHQPRLLTKYKSIVPPQGSSSRSECPAAEHEHARSQEQRALAYNPLASKPAPSGSPLIR